VFKKGTSRDLRDQVAALYHATVTSVTRLSNVQYLEWTVKVWWIKETHTEDD